MSDNLPPLTALRAFEAAARHMSFAGAAGELNVTPAALSFQIKSLEDHLGAPVFKRLNRAIELTEVGQLLVPGTRDGFETLTAAWRGARRFLDQTHITVTAGPAFTSKWLAPRMYDFAQAHPDIELRFSAALRMMDLGRDDVDVAVRFGYGPDDGVYSQWLLADYFTPLCTPDLAKTLTTPADLLHHPLLYSDDTAFLDPPCDWQAWLQAAGVDAAPPTGTHFNQADHALDAAMAEAGVVLGRMALAHKPLREGRLVAPFKTALSTDAHFRVLCPLGSDTRPHIAAFLDWIDDQAHQVRDTMADFTVVPAAQVVTG